MSEQIFQTVDAHGIETARFDRAKFNVSVDAQGTSAPEAKAALAKLVVAFKAVYEKLKTIEGVKIDDSSYGTNSSVIAHQEYDRKKNEYKQKGFRAAFSASFDLMTPDLASEVYDALTEMEAFQVTTPEFHLKHQEALKLKALQNAHSRLIERFNTECKIMGVDPDAYKVVNWRVNYGNGTPVRAMSSYGNAKGVDMAIAASAAGPDIDIEAPLAIVTVSLTVNYTLKEEKKNAGNK